MNYGEAYQKLEQYGQLHVLKYYQELTEGEQEKLLAQIEDVDFGILQYCKDNPTNKKGLISPLAAMQLEEKTKKNIPGLDWRKSNREMWLQFYWLAEWVPGWGRMNRKACMILE